MEKGTIIVRHISTGGFEEMRWGVSLFRWLHDGKLQTSHAPSQDILDLLFFMIPLTPEHDSAKKIDGGGYTIKDGIISKSIRDLTPEEIELNEQVKIQTMSGHIQKHLDQKAIDHGYDNIVNACGYASAENPFQVESMAFVAWRGNCWSIAYGILAEVGSGERSEPTPEELIAEMPEFSHQ